MATVNYTVSDLPARGDNAHVIEWTLASGDEGQPLEMPGWSRRSAQVSGTFGGGKMRIEGSNNGTDYNLLRDINGNALIYNSGGIAEVGVLPRYIRPRITGGGGSTSLTLTLLIRKETRW